MFRRILLHAAAFLFPPPGLLALLPVVAARRWHLGPVATAFGGGHRTQVPCSPCAVAGACLKTVRQPATGVSTAYGSIFVAIARLPFAAAIPFLVLSGMAWLITLFDNVERSN